MSFWNRGNGANQSICLISETNIAKDEVLEADLLHASSPDTAEGWLLNSRQMVRDEYTDRYIQFVSSKYGCPIKIFDDKGSTPAPDIEVISSETEDQEMVFTTEESSKSSMLLWVGIATAFLCLTVLIIAVMVVA